MKLNLRLYANSERSSICYLWFEHLKENKNFSGFVFKIVQFK